MPILDVELVAAADAEAPRGDVAQALADAAGEVLATPAGRTWVRVRRLDRGDYAENGGVAAGVAPVFVTVWKADPPGDRAAEARALAAAVAEVLGRPPVNVHVLFAPPCRGRIAFGGELVE